MFAPPPQLQLALTLADTAGRDCRNCECCYEGECDDTACGSYGCPCTDPRAPRISTMLRRILRRR